MKKISILIIGLLLVKLSISQEKYLLRWNVSEPIVYDVGVERVNVNKDDFDSFIEGVSREIGRWEANKFEKLLERSVSMQNKINESLSNRVILTKFTDNRFNVRWFKFLKENTELSKKEVESAKMQTGVKLRGDICDNGSVYSQFLQREQKNLLSIFFQLPTDSVEIGDSWDLDLQWIVTNHRFKCDSFDLRHSVELQGVTEINGEIIASLLYKLEEYMIGEDVAGWDNTKSEALYKFTNIGVCRFNITKGKWEFYDMINEVELHGAQNSSYRTRMYLKEVEYDDYFKNIVSNSESRN